MVALAFIAFVVGSVVTITGAIFASWAIVIAAPVAASIATLVTGGVLAMLRWNAVNVGSVSASTVKIDSLNAELAAELRHVAARMEKAEEASRLRQCRGRSTSGSSDRKAG